MNATDTSALPESGAELGVFVSRVAITCGTAKEIGGDTFAEKSVSQD
jgi:hypothetical protein